MHSSWLFWATYCVWRVSVSITLLLSSCSCPWNICSHPIKCPRNNFPVMEPCCSTLPKIDFSCNAPILSLLQSRHRTSSHRALSLVWLLITALHGPSVCLDVISGSSVGCYDLLMTSSDINYCRVGVEHTAITLRKKGYLISDPLQWSLLLGTEFISV